MFWDGPFKGINFTWLFNNFRLESHNNLSSLMVYKKSLKKWRIIICNLLYYSGLWLSLLCVEKQRAHQILLSHSRPGQSLLNTLVLHFQWATVSRCHRNALDFHIFVTLGSFLALGMFTDATSTFTVSWVAFCWINAVLECWMQILRTQFLTLAPFLTGCKT